MNRYAWVALDVSSDREAEARMERLAPHRAFKIGSELYHRIGPDGVRRFVRRGFDIFLDLKLHDIPRTVERAVANLSELGVTLLTVHVAGGSEMMKAAKSRAGATKVVGVTVLTSLDAPDLRQLGIALSPVDLVREYANLARASGLDGVVVSAEETALVRRDWPEARLVVPGIRWPDDQRGDQKRVGAPKSVIALGATDLVLGRALWTTDDPTARLRAILQEVETR